MKTQLYKVRTPFTTCPSSTHLQGPAQCPFPPLWPCTPALALSPAQLSREDRLCLFHLCVMAQGRCPGESMPYVLLRGSLICICLSWTFCCFLPELCRISRALSLQPVCLSESSGELLRKTHAQLQSQLNQNVWVECKHQCDLTGPQ